MAFITRATIVTNPDIAVFEKGGGGLCVYSDYQLPDFN